MKRKRKKKVKLENSKEIQKFVEGTIERMLHWFPTRISWEIVYKKEKHWKKGKNSFCLIAMDYVSQNTSLSIFIYTDFLRGRLTKRRKTDIEFSIAHEIGHAYIFDLYAEAINRYASEDKLYYLDELVATNIGWLLYGLCRGEETIEELKGKKERKIKGNV